MIIWTLISDQSFLAAITNESHWQRMHVQIILYFNRCPARDPFFKSPLILGNPPSKLETGPGVTKIPPQGPKKWPMWPKKKSLPSSYPQKIYLAKKMVQNGHLWPQQLPIHSTPAYTGSRPPTRWSISSISERSSGWAINYSQRVVAAVSLFVNRETAMLSNLVGQLTSSWEDLTELV